MPSPALITSHLANAFLNILAAKIANNIKGNPPFFSFVSFLTVSLIHCNNNSDSSSDLPIFIISFIPSFKIINAVVPENNLIHKLYFQ